MDAAHSSVKAMIYKRDLIVEQINIIILNNYGNLKNINCIIKFNIQ